MVDATLKSIVDAVLNPNIGLVSVIASAGAGKTFTLTSVYLSLLLRGVNPDLILAITFTNKAADEMKERVFKRLISMAMDGEEIEFFSELLNMPKDLIKQKAKDILITLLFDYPICHIKTIDSFLNSLRTLLSMEIGLSPYSRIRTSVRWDVDLIVAQMLQRAKLEPELKKDILRFVKYYSEGLAVYQRWDPIDYARWLFPTYLDKESQSGIELSCPIATNLMPFIKEVLHKRDKFLEYIQDASLMLSSKLEEFLLSLDEKKLLSVKDVTSEYVSSRYLDFDMFKKNALKGKNKDSEDVLFAYELWTKFLLSFYDLDYQFSRQFPYPFLHIYSCIKDELFIFQQRNDVSYLPLIQMDINKLDPIYVAEMYAIKMGKFRYFLIDEFQDTSLSQWRAMFSIFEDAISSGATLFCVGDPKQTIYRWRGSYPDMFGIMKDSFNCRFAEFVLERNWRSLPQIVEFNNSIFSEAVDTLFSNLNKIRIHPNIWGKIKDAFSPEKVKQVPVKDGVGEIVEIEVDTKDALSSEQEREEIIFSMIEYLNERKSDAIQRCILVRRRIEARQILNHLLASGIPTVSDESLSLVVHPLIVAIVSLLRWINQPHQDFFLYMFFLSDLWAKLSNKDRMYWEKEIRYLNAEKLREFISPFVNSLRFSGVYLLVKDLIDSLQVYDLFPTQRIFIDAFLDVVWRWESENGGNLREFLSYWQAQEDMPVEADKVPIPVGDKALRIMTIHSAKGLEFDEVLLPFLNQGIGDNRNRGLHSTLYWEMGDQLEIHYINSHMAKRNQLLTEIYNKEYTLRVWDDLNLLYVAMTRAKKRLVLFVDTNRSKKGVRWQDVVFFESENKF